MLCCCVRWSEAPSSGKIWIALIVSAGPMPRNMCQVGQIGSNHWIAQVENHGTVRITKLELAVIHVTMKLMEKLTNTFAHFVWLGGRQVGHPEKECPHRKQNSKTNMQLPITRVQQLQGRWVW